MESYAHWIVTSMNMSLIVGYEIEMSLWDTVKRDRFNMEMAKLDMDYMELQQQV